MAKLFKDENGNLTTQRPKHDKQALAVLSRSIEPVEFFTDAELAAVPAGDVFIFDTECYVNFWYAAFKHFKSGKIVAFERSPACDFIGMKLSWMLWRFCLVGFNSFNYDIPMVALAISGASCKELKEASDFIIKSGPQYGTKKVSSFDFERQYKVNIPNCNHIDLFNVAPLDGSLKLYAARIHCKRMQDLPIEADAILTEDEAAIVRPYCCNDLDNTEILYRELLPQIELRAQMSIEYNVDLRSKSDAQVAEAVINSELAKVLGYYPRRPTTDRNAPQAALRYNPPSFIAFETETLQRAYAAVCEAEFWLDEQGSPTWPVGLGEIERTKTGKPKYVLRVNVGTSSYKLGMGGLHSSEESVAHIASDEIILSDNDVESYYPRTILNQRLFPEHLGEAFLIVYNTLVERRLKAKGLAKDKDLSIAERNKIAADSLKIVINGSFGKLGNKYSTLFAPQLMLQVTITGQFALLMLVEVLVLNGIEVVSGNTDGIVLKYHKRDHEKVRAIISEWEERTAYKTEETRYAAIYSRDVNNYIAAKLKYGTNEIESCKVKGVYSEKGSALNSRLSKNPESLICSEAVQALIKNKTPIVKTITECRDFRKFVSVKNVKGGGEKNGVYLGKVVRWYYALNETGAINYVLTGNKVAKSEGGKPAMDLPPEFPQDIDFNYYIKEAEAMLYDIGYLRKQETKSLFI